MKIAIQRLTIIVFFISLFLFFQNVCFAEEVTLEAPAEASIDGLTWLQKDLSIELADGKTFTILKGIFLHPQWTLVINGRIVPLNQDRTFQIKVNVSEPQTSISIYAIGTLGDYETQEVLLNKKTANQTPLPPKTYSKNKKYQQPLVYFGIGTGGLRYSDAYSRENPIDFLSPQITAKAALFQRLKENNLSVRVNAFFTGLPSTSKTNSSYVYFMGMNAGIGKYYALPQGWSLTLSTGVYYTTTYVKNSMFGFKNMNGLQFYPSVSKTFFSPKPMQMSGYVKFSPVLSGLHIAPLLNNEKAAGLQYQWINSHHKPISVTFDYLNMNIHLTGAEPVSISAATYTIGLLLGI